MNPFVISRINTSAGIFRISGRIVRNETTADVIVINELEIMGTDGWFELNIEKSQEIIDQILPEIKAHLS
ncbi:hypothetical protein D5R81_15060 [Parashewanella spongiae]|uniref:Uncharacterized protein n=1 Tax=Parashewanella spongiae TaxID=342950 RepID=A0A3A6TFJ2_9GAMM|nr:hypothetical protein [Parashewanella spongiae]MBE8168868.1 hypothetical protein [Shewanella sp.]MCL1079074.1 hypothetical protein [Parashewanella spongiae]RJY07852.1 hypothetical protein D5R81_15060 [Parashewanella spongiae]